MAQRRPARRRDDPEDGGPTQTELVVGVGGLVLLAFGAFVWNVYSDDPAPRIAPPSAAYKSRPPADDAPGEIETRTLDAVIEGGEASPGPVEIAPAAEAPAPAALPGARPILSPDPVFAAHGVFVAQLAALQSQDAVAPAWDRLASRAPQLFAPARLDVERADLGARGTYYRVRAGYFADRENVGRFCERIKAMGQDCIAVRR